MNVFNPEAKEYSESGFEKNKFSHEVEKKLQEALAQGKEKFPDIVQCPNSSCGCPVKVEISGEEVVLQCTNCGWKHLVKIPNVYFLA